MSRYLNGVFYANKVKQKAPAIFCDEITTRMGALKWYVDHKFEIRAERLNSLWLLWDEDEGPEPKCLYYQAPASKRWLAGVHPKHAKEIEGQPNYTPAQVPMVGFSQQHDTERCKVVEAWSLPMGDLPGRHVIQLESGLNLVDEKWEFERFPVVAFRWAPNINSIGMGSYGGKPLIEIIMNHHLWFNKITRIMGEASKGAVPKILAEANSEVKDFPFSDKIHEVVRFKGPNAPTIIVPTNIGVDLKYLRDAIRSNAYELAGVNQQAAQGTTGGALVSQPAQRERMDIVSTRLIHPTEGFEGGWRESGEVIVMLASKAYRNRQARVRAPGTRLLEEISWQDIDLREDEYAITVESTAALPLTVGGRLDFVNDLMQMKGEDGMPLIKGRDALKMMQIPDTEAALDRETAAQDLADHQVEEALWEGNYIPPEPIQDLGGSRRHGEQGADAGAAEPDLARRQPGALPPAHRRGEDAAEGAGPRARSPPLPPPPRGWRPRAPRPAPLPCRPGPRPFPPGRRRWQRSSGDDDRGTPPDERWHQSKPPSRADPRPMPASLEYGDLPSPPSSSPAATAARGVARRESPEQEAFPGPGEGPGDPGPQGGPDREGGDVRAMPRARLPPHRARRRTGSLGLRMPRPRTRRRRVGLTPPPTPTWPCASPASPARRTRPAPSSPRRTGSRPSWPSTAAGRRPAPRTPSPRPPPASARSKRTPFTGTSTTSS
jgi:hypothetical protein